jgi:molecular chaperone DnaJ
MAIIKDYYRILNVRSSASVNEIKNAYRKLAMKYHPDKNPNDALSAAVFTDVAEAYHVLSDDKSRKLYNEERYITATQEYRKPIETIDTLIFRADKINEQLKDINPFQFNKDALLYSISQLLPTEIDLLLYTNENLFQQFFKKVIAASKYLSSQQTKQLILLLQPLYEKNEWLQQSMQQVLQKQLKDERWEKNKIVLAVIVALILCALIFFVASK